MLILVPPEVPKKLFAEPFPQELAKAVSEHNAAIRGANGSGCAWCWMQGTSFLISMVQQVPLFSGPFGCWRRLYSKTRSPAHLAA